MGVAFLGAASCMPYSVGRTAASVPRGKVEYSTIGYYVLPIRQRTISELENIPAVGVDNELRLGIDGRSDIAVRLMGISGLVVAYKRQLNPRRPIVANIMSVEGGAGMADFDSRALTHATFMMSSHEGQPVSPYGGIRSFATFPTSLGVGLRSRFAGGVFTGVRLRGEDVGITAEIGIFYASVPESRNRHRVIYTPSFGIHRIPRVKKRFPVPPPIRFP